MQEPLFVLAITFLFFLLALNMSGIFSFGEKIMSSGSTLASKQNLKGTFFSGSLATIAATPCSAPLLGTALGATLGMSGLNTFLIFITIGFGMSLPYLLLSVAPSMVKYLPKPGAWMESFKQFLAFPLYATVAYLLWILNGQLPPEQLLKIYFALTLIAFAAWIYGRWTLPIRPSSTKNVARIAALTIIAMAIWMSTQKQEDIWEPWSEEKVSALRAEGRIIYIDFTARWCATCQVNKSSVLSSDKIIDAFNELNVATLKADWTNSDPAITKALEKYGRVAVPTNIVYLPGKDKPEILPEILTPQLVLDALKQ